MITIEYQDISLTAKDDLTSSATDKQTFSNLTLFKTSGVNFKKYATFENNFWRLDGTFENFPNNPTQEKFALWSTQQSASDKTISNQKLTLTFSGYETSSGITLIFSSLTNDYATSFKIKWYSGTTLLSEKNCTCNKSTYFCENLVELYNKIEIEFYSMNEVGRYLKIENIIFGEVKIIEDKNLRALSLVEEISPTSEEISINTLEFTMNSVDFANILFQNKQPLALYRDGKFFGVFFIDKTKRKSETLYEVNAVDYIGILENKLIEEKTYTNQTLKNVVADIVGDLPFEIDAEIENTIVNGTIQSGSCRDALMQVLFSCCAVCDTSRSEKIKIYKLNDEIKSDVSSGIYDGMEFETNDILSEIQLQLPNGTIATKTNERVTSKYNNAIQFLSNFATNSNKDTILNYLYKTYVTDTNNNTNMKFIVNNEKCGDVISYSTKYLGKRYGRIKRMQFNFNSNKLVAECELKDVTITGV